MSPKLIFGAAGLVLLGALVALAGVAVSGGFSSATPARTTATPAAVTPSAMVDAYLRDRLVDRNDAAAKTLQCRTPSLAPMDSYVADLTSREQKDNVTIDSTWTGLAISTTSTGATTVRLDLTRSIATTERTSTSWTFGLTDENGWKVCSASPA